MLLGALCVELAPFKGSKYLLRGLILASILLAYVDYEGRPTSGRYEDWRSAAAWLDEQRSGQGGPVLLYSGLIEAQLLRAPHDPFLEDYCLFPLTSLYPIAAARSDLVPLPLDDPGRLDPSLRARVIQRGVAWLVVRASPDISERIAKQLLSDLHKHDPDHQWQTTASRAFGDLVVFRIAP
jgi:hypothetical protein